MSAIFTGTAGEWFGLFRDGIVGFAFEAASDNERLLRLILSSTEMEQYGHIGPLGPALEEPQGPIAFGGEAEFKRLSKLYEKDKKQRSEFNKIMLAKLAEIIDPSIIRTITGWHQKTLAKKLAAIDNLFAALSPAQIGAQSGRMSYNSMLSLAANIIAFTSAVRALAPTAAAVSRELQLVKFQLLLTMAAEDQANIKLQSQICIFESTGEQSIESWRDQANIWVQLHSSEPKKIGHAHKTSAAPKPTKDTGSFQWPRGLPFEEKRRLANQAKAPKPDQFGNKPSRCDNHGWGSHSTEECRSESKPPAKAKSAARTKPKPPSVHDSSDEGSDFSYDSEGAPTIYKKSTKPKGSASMAKSSASSVAEPSSSTADDDSAATDIFITVNQSRGHSDRRNQRHQDHADRLNQVRITNFKA